MLKIRLGNKKEIYKIQFNNTPTEVFTISEQAIFLTVFSFV